MSMSFLVTVFIYGFICHCIHKIHHMFTSTVIDSWLQKKPVVGLRCSYFLCDFDLVMGSMPKYKPSSQANDILSQECSGLLCIYI